MNLYRYLINSNRLFNICCDLIDKYEKPGIEKLKRSCKDDLKKYIKDEIKSSKKEISEWKDFDTDYIKIAHSILANLTFNLLSSGKYHIYYGILNPLSCAFNLKLVYRASMNFALTNNIITEEERKEQEKLLKTRISQIG